MGGGDKMGTGWVMREGRDRQGMGREDGDRLGGKGR